MSRHVIGIDIGGTKIAVCLATLHGKILTRETLSSHSGRAPERSIREITETISALLKKRKLRKNALMGIGVGVPGPVDIDEGVVGKSPHLPAWKGLPLKRMLARTFQAPVIVDNDANAAALGEWRFGSGWGFSNFLYVTVSTGIGSGLVCEGKLVHGASGSAGELGHITVARNGRRCHCGKKGCLEAYASGTAIGEYVREALRKGKRSRFFRSYRRRVITGALVTKAARQRDPLAIEAVQYAGDYLGIGLANVVNLLNPERIILGGGVMERPRYIWPSMKQALQREAWQLPLRDCRVMRSKLKGRSGDLGAVALILNYLNTRKRKQRSP